MEQDKGQKLGRVELRKRRNREALIEAGHRVITEKGIDDATMHEIADLADVGAGTVYSYFKSKDELVIAVMEKIMHRLALRIERVTDTFEDPAQVYAFGVRTVLETATQDMRWKQVLDRSEFIAEAMYSRMGIYAVRDIGLAAAAGRFIVTDANLAWRLACHGIIGLARAINRGDMAPSSINEAVIRLLCMNGLTVDEAREIAQRPRPELTPNGEREIAR